MMVKNVFLLLFREYTFQLIFFLLILKYFSWMFIFKILLSFFLILDFWIDFLCLTTNFLNASLLFYFLSSIYVVWTRKYDAHLFVWGRGEVRQQRKEFFHAIEIDYKCLNGHFWRRDYNFLNHVSVSVVVLILIILCLPPLVCHLFKTVL